MDAADSRDPGGSDIAGDTLFELLGSRFRRAVLFHLRQHGTATIEELTEIVATLDTPEDREPTEEEVRDARIALHHRELPKLEQLGLVTVDSEAGLVEVEALPADVAEWLDLAVHRELREREAESDAGIAGSERPTVLVVDDDPGYVDLVENYLERDDVEAITETNALDAFAHIEGNDVDCVVSDYKMPMLDGLDLLREVRRSYPDLPFVMLTNKGSEEVASEAIQSGVSDYVLKGVEPEQLEQLGDRIRDLVELNEPDEREH